MTEPTTQAGRALWDADNRLAMSHAEYGEAIATIEAEARAEAEATIEALPEAAQRLCDAIANEAAVKGLARDGFSQGWKAEVDAEDALLCALQDTRMALDGRDRPHRHLAALREQP